MICPKGHEIDLTTDDHYNIPHDHYYCDACSEWFPVQVETFVNEYGIKKKKTQREIFSEWIKNEIEDPSVWVVAPDFGYKTLDAIATHHRFVNAGIAEQNAVLIAVGLALQGKRVYIYSIATFILYRAFEQIRNYVNKMSLNITIVGVGRDLSYASLDFSHHATDDLEIVAAAFKNLKVFNPGDEVSMVEFVLNATRTAHPCYVRLK